ncbi:MAG: hypothetical protein JRG95_24315, partial [Deltaproteobacteria bacterium]|nr:hypothetical protein [Deltaproteobacteria bacterium]
VFDIEVKNADLVIATHGAGFWILDDISPIRQYSADLAQQTAHLFEPEDHFRFGYNWWLDYGGGPPSDKKYYFVRNAEAGYTFYERGVVNGERKREYINAGDARPQGVILYYLLSDKAKDVSLSILDEQGHEIRIFGADEIPKQQFRSVVDREYSGGQAAGQPRVSISKGLNRFIWDTRYPTVSQVPGLPPVNIKPFAKPGIYQVRLTVDGKAQTQSFELNINPNESYSREETDRKGKGWMALQAKAEDGVQAVLRAHAAKEKVAGALGGSGDLASRAAAIDKLCADLESTLVSTGTTLVQIISQPTKALAKLTMLHNLMETTEGPPNQPWLEVYDKTSSEMRFSSR